MYKPRSISQVVSAMIFFGRKHRSLTVGQCAEMLQGRGLMLVLLVLCLLNSIPVPGIPGFSTVTGIPIVILGFQMLRGSQAVWIPKRLAAHQVNPRKWIPRLKRLLPHVKRMEKMLKPRWGVLSSPTARRVWGVVFIVLGIILALPLPFMNFPVGLAMSLLAIGIILRDGALIVFAVLGSLALMASGVLVVGGLTR
jgi:hypothetical protein